MIPLGLLKFAPMILAMRIVSATLPNGDIERTTFLETEDGVRATIERSVAKTDVKTHRQIFVKKGRYTWKIEEERRSILMAPAGQPTGTTRLAYSLSGFIDASRTATDAPRPVEIFRFYAPTREEANALKDRLRKALD